MTILSHGLVLMSLFASAVDGSPATEIRYNGTLTPDGRNTDGAPAKQFDVFCLLLSGESGRELAFLVEEAGGGSWPWPERFGVMRFDAANKATNNTQVRLLHNHDGTLYPVTLRTPLFEFAEKLREGASWTAGKQAYEVLRSRKVKDRDCWVIDVSTNFGHEQTLFVDKESHLVISADQRVFMGQGDRYSLKFEIESVKPIDAAALALLKKPLETIAKLKGSLNRAENQETKPELTDAQLQAAAAVVDQLTEEAKETPFERYATVIRRDVMSQQQREMDIAGLAGKFVGAKAPDLDLETLSGQQFDNEQNAGQIIVLHFWEYQGKPLVEPYGQVGYLDFLHNKNNKRKLKVKTYGVAVDKRFADAAQRSAAIRSVRQLNEFFNLSYPILLDDGALLARFGDPRRLDAKLPLWVIIGADGKIAHYSTGYYNIKPDEGLKQLETAIVQLVKKQRGRE